MGHDREKKRIIKMSLVGVALLHVLLAWWFSSGSAWRSRDAIKSRIRASPGFGSSPFGIKGLSDKGTSEPYAEELETPFFESRSCGPIEILSIDRGNIEKEYLEFFNEMEMNVPKTLGNISNRLQHSAEQLDKMLLEVEIRGRVAVNNAKFRSFVFGDNGDGTLVTLQRLRRKLKSSSMHDGDRIQWWRRPFRAVGRSLFGRRKWYEKELEYTELQQLENIALALYVVGYRKVGLFIPEWHSDDLNKLYSLIFCRADNRKRLVKIVKKMPYECNEVTSVKDPFHIGSGLERWGTERCFRTFSLDNMSPYLHQDGGGTCAPASASMLKAHKLKLMNPDEPWKIFEFHDIVLQTFDEYDLLQRVVNDVGYNPETILDRTLDDVQKMDVHLDISGQHIEDCLKKHGPAMVDYAYMFEDMMNMMQSGQRSFSGTRSIPPYKPGHENKIHAMLLTGSYQDDDGNWWFLLQNWWPGAEHFEVDYDRLKSMMAWGMENTNAETQQYSPLFVLKGDIKIRDHSARTWNSHRVSYAESAARVKAPRPPKYKWINIPPDH